MTLAEPLSHNGSSHALDFGIQKASPTPEAGLTEASACRGNKPWKEPQNEQILLKALSLKLHLS